MILVKHIVFFSERKTKDLNVFVGLVKIYCRRLLEDFFGKTRKILEELFIGHNFKQLKVAYPAGLEPATNGLEIRCSIQLSYGYFHVGDGI
jgi:hypothetical protein